MDWLAKYHSFEATFDAMPIVKWTEEHPEVMIISVVLYLIMVFYLPMVIKKPWNLKPYFPYWNLFLAVFSMIGSYKVIPTLYHALVTHGFEYTICKNPSTWYSTGGVAIWMTLFIYSKIPELLDTFFLVFQKKTVIFLHWYHHFTVLIYCWHAYYTTISAGIWFCAMNYFVHSIMYTYFWLTAYQLPKPIYKFIRKYYAPVVTCAQITQMVIGIVITFTSAMKHRELGKDVCWTNETNYFAGMLMYFSYFLLFAVLFVEKYCGNPKKRIEHTE
jgi:elongation of very long chain fatty acids protein 6